MKREERHHAARQGTSMRELRDVEVTIIDLDTDGDGLPDEELVLIEDTPD